MNKPERPQKPQPRYIEIRKALEDNILSGTWQPGDRVPSELELVEAYGCSRMTVNKALSALADAGLIVRRRRSGSFVAAPAAEETVLEIQDIAAEIRASGRPYRHAVLWSKRRKAGPEDAARSGGRAGTWIRALGVLHFAGAAPQLLEDRLISLSSVPAAAEVDFASVPPGTWLLEHIPWTEAEHRIRAVAAGEEVAAHLDLSPGAPCLQVERRTWRQGKWVTAVRLTHPGDRHELVARFAPSSTHTRSSPA